MSTTSATSALELAVDAMLAGYPQRVTLGEIFDLARNDTDVAAITARIIARTYHRLDRLTRIPAGAVVTAAEHQLRQLAAELEAHR